MKVYDGVMRRSRGIGGYELFVILQQSQAEGQRLSLTVQHVSEHGRQVLMHNT